MSLLYPRIFSCFITVNTLFLLFSFITVESAFKMAAIQVLTQEPEVPGSIPDPAAYFLFSFRRYDNGSY